MVYRHEIEKIAYELYQRDNYVPGRELDHWIEAERIFQSRQAAIAETKPPVSTRDVTEGAVKKKVAANDRKTADESKPSRTSPAEVKSKRPETTRKKTKSKFSQLP